ncbi:glycoside hydrolase family 43 protein [Cellulomonas marina]|uniref:Alpha-N-arabinofuranosidase n=1 Tax=Cellulomonas marina TaxID=988821 RepID=A0A1I0YQ74_9CELL|nr:glycoside hydrolase family 43 protein [Cellulomonas marina]GIG27635.1 glycoside hydrolase 43 family protein [Cellulomonas marina]SFB14458.1 alpha-N-arabinofuranosidase [Cellulomonas marina]
MTLVANPLLPGTYPDPSICRVGEDYYLVTSTFEYVPGLPVLHSRDLAHWTQVGHVVDREGMLDYEGLASSGGLYAPTIRHHDGLFWVVCTLVDQTDPTRGGNFIVTASDPAGPWSDPFWLATAGIDPSLVVDEDGRMWVHGTRLVAEPEWPQQTEVWLRELDRSSMRLVGPEHVLWTGAVRGAVWAEGPHLFAKDGRWYLLAAEGGTEFHHAVCVARADHVTGPYEGYAGNPVLTHRHLGHGGDVVGVGHADLVEAVDGSWWAVLLGMRPYGGYHHNLGRETFLVPVTWEDGWPVFAPGLGRVPHEVEVPFAEPTAPAGVPQVVPGGPVLPGDPRWTALRAPVTSVATADGDGWLLPVRPSTLADATTPAFLGVRQQHVDVDVRAVLDLGGLAAGESAGLVVRQSERDHVTLMATPGGDAFVVRAVHRRGGVETVLGETVVRPVDGGLTLGLRVRGQEYGLVVEEAGDDVVVAVADGTTLDSVATGGFVGLWLGVVATSAGRPTDSTVRVERFAYDPLQPLDR